MSHTIIYNPETRIIEVTIQGDLFLNEVKEITAEVTRVAKDQNCFLVLNDLREATLKLSTAEIYELPKTISDILALSGLHAYKFSRALVAGQDLADLQFLENVTANRGQNAKRFQELDKAKQWLSEK